MSWIGYPSKIHQALQSPQIPILEWRRFLSVCMYVYLWFWTSLVLDFAHNLFFACPWGKSPWKLLVPSRSPDLSLRWLRLCPWLRKKKTCSTKVLDCTWHIIFWLNQLKFDFLFCFVFSCFVLSCLFCLSFFGTNPCISQGPWDHNSAFHHMKKKMRPKGPQNCNLSGPRGRNSLNACVQWKKCGLKAILSSTFNSLFLSSRAFLCLTLFFDNRPASLNPTAVRAASPITAFAAAFRFHFKTELPCHLFFAFGFFTLHRFDLALAGLDSAGRFFHSSRCLCLAVFGRRFFHHCPVSTAFSLNLFFSVFSWSLLDNASESVAIACSPAFWPVFAGDTAFGFSVSALAGVSGMLPLFASLPAAGAVPPPICTAGFAGTWQDSSGLPSCRANWALPWTAGSGLGSALCWAAGIGGGQVCPKSEGVDCCTWFPAMPKTCSPGRDCCGAFVQLRRSRYSHSSPSCMLPSAKGFIIAFAMAVSPAFPDGFGCELMKVLAFLNG